MIKKAYLVHTVMHAIFHFCSKGISKENLELAGTVVTVTVWSHDQFMPNDFIGEVFVNLSSLHHVEGMLDIDDLPVTMMALRRPVETQGAFQVNIDLANFILFENFNYYFNS